MRHSGRLRLAAVAAAGLLAATTGVRAAGVEKKIVIVRSGNFPLYDFAAQGFKQGLSDRKVQFSVEERVMPDENIDGFMRSLRAGSPDLVFTIGTLAARVFQEKGRGIPFVYAMIVDPPSLGLSAGGAVMETRPAAQLAFIRKNFPALRRVGVIHSSSRNRETVRLFNELKAAGMPLVLIQADSPEEVSKGILRLAKEADCLLMVSDAVLYSSQTSMQVILQTIQNNLPIIAVSPSFVKAGALAAVYPDYADNGDLAAEVAVRYFKGESLSSIPVQWPVRTRSAVNMIIAKRLGISVPEKTLESASEVVR